MRTLSTIAELRAALKPHRGEDSSIGFVPTMGALHEGHISLVRLSKQQNQVTVVSIFVNPTQFSPDEDFDAYPRTIEQDEQKLVDAEVDFLFLPSIHELYPAGAVTTVSVVGPLSQNFEGAIRPTHFEGVATVVSILFHCVEPTVAYFGQKDAQQVAVIKRMARDLALPIDIRVGPIIRESTGLALSSRNRYLDPAIRTAASAICSALQAAAIAVRSGATFTVAEERAKTLLRETLPACQLDYLAFIDSETFQSARSFDEHDEVVLAVAVRLGTTRLIDNIIVEKPPAP